MFPCQWFILVTAEMKLNKDQDFYMKYNKSYMCKTHLYLNKNSKVWYGSVTNMCNCYSLDVFIQAIEK